jgi:hemoglobin-like flavoprotein
MNNRQKMLVQTTFEQVRPIADEAAALFYRRLFELDPSLRPMFHGDLREQGRKLMSMIQMVVGSLYRLDKIVPAIQGLGRRHAGYGVRPEHYQTVAAALLWTLEQGLGEAFTPEVKAAWVAAYTLLAEVMQAAAASAEPVAASAAAVSGHLIGSAA